MTLIVLLIILFTERVALQTSIWQVPYYLNKYVTLVLPKFNKGTLSSFSLFLFVAFPALALTLVLTILDSGFINFLVSLFVLAICIGNSDVRVLYRQYLNALGRKDTEAQLLLHDKLLMLGSDKVMFNKSTENEIELSDRSNIKPLQEEDKNSGQEESIGETLIWINFIYYAVPIFYFVLFGAPFVVFYVTLLFLTQHEKSQGLSAQLDRQKLFVCLGWMFWLPSRLVSLGFMIVGHFSNGLEVWLKYAVDFSKSSREMLCKVAINSDHIDASSRTNNAQHMVRLTKRNMILFIVFVALLTLYGQIV